MDIAISGNRFLAWFDDVCDTVVGVAIVSAAVTTFARGSLNERMSDAQKVVHLGTSYLSGSQHI